MMNSSTEHSDLKKLFDYVHSFVVSKTMFAAAELGVFDLLRESEVPLSTSSIAERLKISIRGTDVLLNSCVGLKLLEKEQNNEKVFFRNTELANLYLAKLSPKSIYHMMIYFSHSTYLSCHYMTSAVREGKSQYQKAFGTLSEDVFVNVYRTEDEMIAFVKCMDSMWNVVGVEEVVSAFDLSPFTNICDLGGCSGAVAKQWISVYPESRVTIFDLPEVVQIVKTNFIPPDEQRIILQGGDFFKDPIPEADLYIISRVIHDFPEQQVLELLSKVYETCKPGGGVLLIDTLFNEDKCGPIEAHIRSLIMLIATEGTERTSSEYNKLLTTAGFREIEIRTTGKLNSAIFARK